MTLEELRNYEQKMHEETNEKVLAGAAADEASSDEANEKLEKENKEEDATCAGTDGDGSSSPKTEVPDGAAAGYGNPVTAVASGIKSWFSWS